MIGHLLTYTLPAAYAVLPPEMSTDDASAFLIAIALQESGGTHRHQVGGPAVGFWQFERNGITGVLTHRSTRHLIEGALTALCYPPPFALRESRPLMVVLEHNDTVAAVFARLLLWTLPDPLPTAEQPDEAWRQYREAWRPGKPRHETWAENFAEAWGRVVP